jgi:hypothetical protein
MMFPGFPEIFMASCACLVEDVRVPDNDEKNARHGAMYSNNIPKTFIFSM